MSTLLASPSPAPPPWRGKTAACDPGELPRLVKEREKRAVAARGRSDLSCSSTMASCPASRRRGRSKLRRRSDAQISRAPRQKSKEALPVRPHTSRTSASASATLGSWLLLALAFLFAMFKGAQIRETSSNSVVVMVGGEGGTLNPCSPPPCLPPKGSRSRIKD